MCAPESLERANPIHMAYLLDVNLFNRFMQHTLFLSFSFSLSLASSHCGASLLKQEEEKTEKKK